jgi:hypothetical protein
VQKLTNGKTIIPKIFALDPSSSHFESHVYRGFEAISKTDATYVQIIHTNGGTLGMQRECGTVDFYPNGGSRQPGCEDSPLNQDVCSHNRAWEIYQNSIVDPYAFVAIKCASYDDFLNQANGGRCDRNDFTYVGFGAFMK